MLDHRLVLVVFGLTGLLDAAGSLTLALHFRHALAHEAISLRRERLALRLVSVGLIAVGLFTLVESTRRLIAHSAGHDSRAGIVIVSSSAVVLALLTLWKRAAARRARSAALRADSWLSATGTGLAIIALVGSTLGTSLYWVDGASALVVACIAAGVGAATLRREEAALVPPSAHHGRGGYDEREIP